MARLERVERQNRWMKLLGAVVLALAGAVLLMGQAFPKIEEASSFLLRDREGNIRSTLITGADGSVIQDFYDKAGKARITLSVLPDGSPRLQFYDNAGTPRAGLVVLPDSSGLVFSDRNKKPRVTLSMLADGVSGLQLLDPNGKPRAVLGALPDGSPRLEFLDADGKVLFQAP